MELFIGTSAFDEKKWKGSFYPEDIRQEEMLGFYAARLAAVEINRTFYRFPSVTLLESWAQQVPEQFRFFLKANQKITHFKRLKDVASETEDFFRNARSLGSRLGGVFIQLPPNLKLDIDRLVRFLALIPRDVPSSFEFRHPTWQADDVFNLLRAHNCALCIADNDESPAKIVSTADWGYLRLRREEYTPADLQRWLDDIRSQAWRKAYVFIKHEESGKGPEWAQELIKLAA